MKIYLAVVRIIGWVLIGFVSIKVVAATYLGVHAGVPVGKALGDVLWSFMGTEDSSKLVFFYAAVTGVGFLIKARIISKAIRKP